MNKHRGTPTTPLLSSSVYDGLKFTVQIVLPAIGTLYFTLAGIWGFPFGEEVVGTVTALALFGGVVLGISNSSYKNSDQRFDGAVVDDGTRDIPLFEFNEPFENLVTKDEITLKVDNRRGSQ